MTDPQPVPGRKTPRRAEPLQPDKPGSGQGRQPADGEVDSAGNASTRKSEKASEQANTSQTALENVREGYG